jgi:thioredoxin reductase (NADPH)
VANVSEQIRDVIIIGSGPAGYTAALYTARAQLEPLVFEGHRYGGALMTTTEVENYPGFRDGIQGPDLMEQFRAQAERFGAELIAKDVTSVELRENPKRVTVDDTTYLARSVILAMGAQARYLDVPGEQRLLGRGVSSCATCDGFFFRDQDIAVIGGGDSAMEEATFLTKFAQSVTVVHRRDQFRASKIMLERAKKHDKIHFLTNTVVEEVYDVSHKEVTGLKLRDVRNGKSWDFPTSAMFLGIGHIPNAKIFDGQLDMDPDGYLITTEYVFTKVHGVFACGDVQDRRYRQAITAAGSGCMAALEVEKYLEDLEDKD